MKNYQKFPKSGTKSRAGKANLTRTLDTVFSKVIRLRDCGGTITGIGRCITCDTPLKYWEGQCGHYLSRRHKAIRWNLHNSWLQCETCNNMMDEKLEAVYREKLISIIGIVEVEKIESMKDNPAPTTQEMKNILEFLNSLL